MRYFGLNLGHDSSLVGFDECGEIFFYAQSERYGERIKNYGGDLRPIFENFPDLRINKGDIVTVCPCFLRDNPDEEKSHPAEGYDDRIIRKCDKKYAATKIGLEGLRLDFLIDHHLAHAISSWCFRSDNEEKFFMSYDGSGPWADERMHYKSSLAGMLSEKGFSIIYDHEKIPSSMPFNHLLGRRSAGKLMGLSGCLPESEEPLTHGEFIKWLNLTCESNFEFGRLFPTDPNPNIDSLVLFSKIYRHYSSLIWDKLKINIDKFASGRGVLIGGGTGLALDINTKIRDHCGNLTFGPPVDDSGLALGAAAFSYFHTNRRWPRPISSPSMNLQTSPLASRGPQEPKEIAKMIFDNKVVGLLRGKSEAGPRALGYRSIFASCTELNNLKRVSEELKGRESYRPLAPIVTEESFDEYFVGPKGRYMQYKCMCNNYCEKELPAIVHKDRSARPQVVRRDDDPWLHELLVEYGKLSGHECFINTSLNGKNKPICNDLKDAESDFRNKNDIILISLGEKNTVKNLLFM